MMNLTHFSFSNVYIYSPITWLHKIRINHKIFTIFSILCLIPYINLSYLLIITLSFFIIIITLKFYQNYYYTCLGILVIKSLYILPYCFSNTNYIIYNTIKIYIPYQICHIWTKYQYLTKSTLINSKAFIQLKIPKFMIRITIISILYSIIIKTLLLTTMYEQIILLICMYIKIDNQYLKKTIFISSFAGQFLERITNSINIIYISIKLRNIHLILCKNKLLVGYYIISKFLNRLNNDIQKVSSVLYSREFNDQNLVIKTI